MPKPLARPLLHKVIIIWYALTPILFSSAVAFYHQTSIIDVVTNFFFYFGTLAGSVVLTSPFVALALHNISRSSWILFIGHNVLILITSILNFVQFLNIKDLLYVVFVLVYFIILIFVFKPSFRLPYMAQIKRGFRIKKRTSVEYSSLLNNINATVVDLSKSGCRAIIKLEDLTKIESSIFVGNQLKLEITTPNEKLQKNAKVVYLTDTNIGLEFIK